MKKRVTIAKMKSYEGDYQGYQVRIGGKPYQVAMGEYNWYPTKAMARKYQKQILKKRSRR